MVRYGFSINEPVQYFNGTVSGTLLHFYLIHFVVYSHVQDIGQSLINDNVTAFIIVKNYFNPCHARPPYGRTYPLGPGILWVCPPNQIRRIS